MYMDSGRMLEIYHKRATELIDAKIREKKLLNYEDFARFFKIPTALQTAARIGPCLPTAHNLAMLADALETSMDYLVGRTDDPTWKN